MVRQLLDVVDQTEQLPLRIDFDLSSQREAIEPLVVSDVSEHRRYRREALAVKRTARGRIAALLHPVGMGLGRGRGFALEEGNLARLGLRGGSSAAIAMRAGHAVTLGAPESDRDEAM
jgi:hypothetical protein